MPRRLAAAVLTLSLQASAEPVRTLDLTQDFGASPSSVSERQAVYDELTVATCLQGLANRSAPNLYLFYVTSAVKAGLETDKLWFDRLSDPAIGGGILDGRSVEPLSDLDAAITAYTPLISGLAVWDPKVPATVNAAFAAAGADDLLVVSYSSDPESWYQKLSAQFDTKISLVTPTGGSVFLDNQGSESVFGTNRQTSQSAKADAYVWALENYLKPGKRSLHTLNSYMVRRADGSPWLVGGTPGGDNQVQTNLQILRHLLAGTDLWSGPTPQMNGNWTQARRSRSERARPPFFDLLAVALEAPRWRLDPNGQLRIESRIPSQIRKKLVSWGHDVVRIGPWEGSGLAQLLLTLSEDEVGSGGADERKTCLHVGATDPRGEGVALGV